MKYDESSRETAAMRILSDRFTWPRGAAEKVLKAADAADAANSTFRIILNERTFSRCLAAASAEPVGDYQAIVKAILTAAVFEAQAQMTP